MNNKLKALISFILILIAISAVALYLAWSQFLNSAASDKSQDVVYEVSPGKGFSSIAEDLEKKGLVKSADLFKVYAKAFGQRSKVKVGEYLLNTNMRPSQIMDILTSGKSISRTFTVSEGLSIFEVAALYEKQSFGSAQEFLRLSQDSQFIKSLLGEEHESLEGYLFPETYSLTKYTNTKTLISNMVKRFLYVYSEIEDKSQLRNWSRHQIVTLASIVEKETGAPEERPLIASVFHNRLLKGMRLQTDPTVIYGKAKNSGRIEINITKADLATPNRYNTYTIKGLPPGPIANPGREALLATVQPATSSYFYFVSQNNGTHIFSEDYKGHLAAVQRFQMDRKAREGKSWRDLKKKSSQ